MRNVIVLTGRGGSKSILKKNLYPVLGRPLAYYPMHAAKQAKLVDEIYVSTDSEEIADLAREMGITPIERPEELSTDTAELGAAIEHALAAIGSDVRYLVSMHCNCAIHREGIIDECIAALDADASVDSCVTGYIDKSIHPFRTKKIAADGRLESWIPIPQGTSTNRQSLEPCFVLDGGARAMRLATCFPPNGQPPFSYLGNVILPRINDSTGDVHDLSDILRAEEHLKSLGWNNA